MPDFAERLKLDRTIALVMLASVVVFAMLAAKEVGGDSWGMVLSLAPYLAIIAAVLTAATIAREFESGPVAFGRTHSLSRRRCLCVHVWVPLLLTPCGGAPPRPGTPPRQAARHPEGGHAVVPSGAVGRPRDNKTS